ncbi:hypothetical protein DXU93_07820 [Brumimicrobium aurantiacum]|uniref:Uncharacterized protein n=2 Tax=Brumimicrobium aurantiacum TaxID=1737063 RepID=A0A3E1EXR0_9FLAO|nr:hypothetical protein DXU93_07820 [Brumimicrobium aurantiacum]
MDITSSCPSSHELYFLEDYIYDEPVVNPNNPFEIAFVRVDPTVMGYDRELCVYNFCTNKLDVLTGDVGSGLDWSIKDWIIFTGSNGSVRVKSNGDSLSSQVNSGFEARWSPSGEKYVYRDPDWIGGTPIKIADETGATIGSIPIYFYSWDWLNENEIVYSKQGNNKLIKYDISTGVSTDIVSHPGIAPSDGQISVDDQQRIYTQIDEAMIRVDLNGNIEYLDTNYTTFSSSFAQHLYGSKILFKRHVLDTTNIGSCENYVATYISILDEATGEERRVKIPE